MMDESFDENNQKEQEAMDSHLAGKGRKRKKQYYKTIRQQMEFYFGDANLSKDRFLNQMLAVDPFVPLSTFMSFNKIKESINSIEDIQKAIDGSDLLELSGDKQSVRRITEVRLKENIDEYVVYVEALPPHSTHESVKHLFKQFGDVVYVSLPKFKTSGRIKEFAFVEFADKNSVEQCINAFRQFDGVIADHNDPERLKSVTSYVKEQEELEEKRENASNDNENKKIQNEDGDKEVGTSTDTEVRDNNADPDLATESDTESVLSQPPRAKRLRLDVDSPSLSESKENDENDSTEETKRKKKRRIRQRRKPKSSDRMKVPNEVLEQNHVFNNIPEEHHQNKKEEAVNSIHVLRVATKIEWKRLRNKYLQLQRDKYAEVKKLLRKQNNGNNNDGKKVSTLPPLVRPVTMKTKPPPNKRICTRNINFYGAMGDDQNSADNTYECSIIDENRTTGNKAKGKTDGKSSPKETQFEFQPGLIVKVNFDQPCVDVADFKAEMKQYGFVQYVDIKEGQSNAYVRVDASRSAPILIKHCAPNRCQILAGEHESEYWAKIARDREQKLSKSVKVPRTRERKMRNLIKNIAEVNVVQNDNESKTTATHIRFCD